MSPARPGGLRVVSGSAKGIRLTTPPGTDTRPTADRVRQALFNSLESLDAVEGAVVLDLFAGSGALAIEALSRGADRAVLVDRDYSARQAISVNLAASGFATRAEVRSGDALAAIEVGGPWDLVLLDPPYRFDEWEDLLGVIVDHLSGRAVVVVESDREVSLAPHLRVIRSKRYGGTVVLFAVPPGVNE